MPSGRDSLRIDARSHVANQELVDREPEILGARDGFAVLRSTLQSRSKGKHVACTP
jgi:hypothetical protein